MMRLLTEFLIFLKKDVIKKTGSLNENLFFIIKDCS